MFHKWHAFLCGVWNSTKHRMFTYNNGNISILLCIRIYSHHSTVNKGKSFADQILPMNSTTLFSTFIVSFDWLSKTIDAHAWQNQNCNSFTIATHRECQSERIRVNYKRQYHSKPHMLNEPRQMSTNCQVNDETKNQMKDRDKKWVFYFVKISITKFNNKKREAAKECSKNPCWIETNEGKTNWMIECRNEM